MAIKPISPSEVTEVKAILIPDYVILAFNNLIIRNWDGHEARVGQDEAVREILKCARASAKSITRDAIFDKNYLDVEPIFRKEKWKVTFDKPGYNETYEANWKFKK